MAAAVAVTVGAADGLLPGSASTSTSSARRHVARLGCSTHSYTRKQLSDAIVAFSGN